MTKIDHAIRYVAVWLVATALWFPSGVAAAEETARAPAFDAEVFPGATRFGRYQGEPPAALAYDGDRAVGYVFSTRAVVASVGFSGKPLDVLVGIDLDGVITGAKIMHQEEPILVVGVSPDMLGDFVAQFRGRDIRQPIKVTARPGAQGSVLHAVAGATVSSVVINDSILRAARAVARSRGLIGGGGLKLTAFEPLDWPALVSDGSIQRKRFTVDEASAALARRGGRLSVPDGVAGGKTYIDLHVGLATPARIGRNLLGRRDYERILGELEAGAHLLFIAADGFASLKGRTWRKTGLFDRFQLIQEDRNYLFRAEDYRRVDRIKAKGAGEEREIGLFVVRAGTDFDPLAPWRLELAVTGEGVGGSTAVAFLAVPYELPEVYRSAAHPGVSGLEDAKPLWQRNWEGRIWEIALLLLGLAVLSAILVFQDALAGRAKLYTAVRYGFLAFTLLFLGWYAGAQLSVLNILTFIDAVRTDFRWEFFLLEPLIFILWGYVALALIFWGRGVFCGWLCPFGALQDLSNRLARRIGIRQLTIPFAVHERLWPIKYIAFMGLFALSIGGISFLYIAAEIEPFKTAIILGFQRSWPYLLFVGALLAAGLFVERFFCRYLCPMGAALALPARMRMFDWLKRRWQCGLQCQVCANRCPVQAIHPDGRINPNECIHCLNCQVNYFDDTVCPPLVERAKRKGSRLTKRLIDRYKEAEAKGENGETP